MKLLWFDLNASYSHASFALPAIHAQGGDPAVEWGVVSDSLNAPVGALVERIVAARPDALAATAWLFTHPMLLQVIGRVKALLPACTVILGGPEFLGDNEIYLRRQPAVDCVFRGEGELEFHKWLAVWNRQEEWESVTGLCWLDDEGAYRDNGLCRVPDFAALAPPEASRFFPAEKPFVQVETSRGCFNDCAFCVSGNDKPVRRIPAEALRPRLQRLADSGVREIRVLDRTFNASPRHALELLDLFSEFSALKFHIEVHPAFLTDEVKVKLAGFPAEKLHVEAGVQSLDDRVLAACGRAGDAAAAVEGLHFLCAQPGFDTHADLIAGLPHYTLGQIFEDIRTLSRLGAAEIQLESLKVLPGTRMRAEAAVHGIVYAPDPPYEVLRSDAMSAADLETARLLSRLLDRWYNAPAWQSVVREIIVEDSGFFEKFLAWLRGGQWLEQPLSVEKRGVLLYGFCDERLPDFRKKVSESWILAGLSPRKLKALE